ncbi:hypothetical protein D9619_008769 [Psilocybe cf. subviscida]|uniref:3-oxoacyl-[acyl-carrier-protein] reductase n=1 Tax=Psilocybe cf. subviscida TaxID=2480587 RepID=A0A8H5BAD1_9AGAR|nr:hypothetical protein D9619_008769 [Psilocybe cf. subviscida]
MSTKVALVTGASQGIGRAIALRLAQDKCWIALTDSPTQKDELDDLKSEIINSGGEAAVYLADVSAEMDMHEMIEDVVFDFGGLDI